MSSKYLADSVYFILNRNTVISFIHFTASDIKSQVNNSEYFDNFGQYIYCYNLQIVDLI